jgi:hypothetical protein
MKNLSILLISFFLLIGCRPKKESAIITTDDLIGTWMTITDMQIHENLSVREEIKETFLADGTFSASGTAIIYLPESGVDVVTMTGPELGIWSIVDGKIKKNYEEITIDRFESKLEIFTREVFEEQIKESIKEPEWLTPISVSKDELVVREIEDNRDFTLTRIDNQSE